jgi:hypothetical protein
MVEYAIGVDLGDLHDNPACLPAISHIGRQSLEWAESLRCLMLLRTAWLCFPLPSSARAIPVFPHGRQGNALIASEVQLALKS